ncbi:VOC family protein [Microlunatus parietis]|uniref:Putative enzyme related to lactoylglutathione lyase n=1 Tax=Microlunatus parietis TaxID=682979 RepID=A0A7Y9I4V0_9ACTN|nr:VOC family protein [Microlunatus parietis]NYE70316.1 putative enzyme related to lactoylglutathione lyase [Microlunatus parietis]
MDEIVWWEIESPDPERAQSFLSALFGWSFGEVFADSELGADYWLIMANGSGIGGLQRAAADRRPAVGTRVYVQVADLESKLDQVTALGGAIERTRTELGGDDRWFATFREPTGVSFGLWTPNPSFPRPIPRPFA